MYYISCKYYFYELGCLEKLMYLIFFIMVLAVIPVIGILTIFVYIGFGIYGGIYCAIEGYKHNTCRGIIFIWVIIRKCDEMSNEYIFNSRYSCFPDCNDWCIKKEEDSNSKNRNREEVKNQSDNSETKKNDNTEGNLEVKDEKKENEEIDKNKNNEENLEVDEKKDNEENKENVVIDNEDNLVVENKEEKKEKLLENENKEEI